MRKLISFCILTGSVIICLYPFLWMFLSSFKTNREIYQPTLLFPENFEIDSYQSLFSEQYLPFYSFFSNSLFISGLQALFATLITAAAAFVFAKYSFRGKSFLFGVAILVILIPKQAMAVPLFDWMLWLGLQGTSWSLIFPGIASGLGIVFFTQVFRKIPNELL